MICYEYRITPLSKNLLNCLPCIYHCIYHVEQFLLVFLYLPGASLGGGRFPNRLHKFNLIAFNEILLIIFSVVIILRDQDLNFKSYVTMIIFFFYNLFLWIMSIAHYLNYSKNPRRLSEKLTPKKEFLPVSIKREKNVETTT